MDQTTNCSTPTEHTQGNLPLGGQWQLTAGFLSPSTTMGSLCAELSFERRTIVMFGKTIAQPRLISWAGQLPYSYSGDTLEPRPFPPRLRQLVERVNAFMADVHPQAPPFNHVLCNLYRDGNDSMGLHADDERELGPDPYIASVSLGAQRCFQIAPKRKHREKAQLTQKTTLQLPSGSLLVMLPPMQRFYLHGIQKTKRAIGPRLNLTFRAIVH